MRVRIIKYPNPGVVITIDPKKFTIHQFSNDPLLIEKAKLLQKLLRYDETCEKGQRRKVFKANKCYEFNGRVIRLTDTLVRQPETGLGTKQYSYTVYSEIKEKQIGEGGQGQIFITTGHLKHFSQCLAYYPDLYPREKVIKKQNLPIPPTKFVDANDIAYNQLLNIMKTESVMTQLDPQSGAGKMTFVKNKYGYKKASYLVMSKGEGQDLLDFIKKEKFSVSTFFSIAKNIGIKLNDLHIKQKIIHRDIKPENILVNGTNIRFIDYAFSVHIGKSTSDQPGTLAYASPQIFYDTNTANIANDVYAYGKTLRMWLGDNYSIEELYLNYNQIANKRKNELTQPAMAKFHLNKAMKTQFAEYYSYHLGKGEIANKINRLETLITYLTHPSLVARITLGDGVKQLEQLEQKKRGLSVESSVNHLFAFAPQKIILDKISFNNTYIPSNQLMVEAGLSLALVGLLLYLNQEKLAMLALAITFSVLATRYYKEIKLSECRNGFLRNLHQEIIEAEKQEPVKKLTV